MQSIKQNVSCDINRVIEYGDIVQDKGKNKIYEGDSEGERPASRLQNRLQVERIIEIFNKKNLDYKKYVEQFIQKYGHPQFDMPAFKWQQSFHDHVIRHEPDFYKHLNYIANNCIKHNICEDKNKYQWSFLHEKWKDLVDDYG
jgi:hypothetical protein